METDNEDSGEEVEEDDDGNNILFHDKSTDNNNNISNGCNGDKEMNDLSKQLSLIDCGSQDESLSSKTMGNLSVVSLSEKSSNNPGKCNRKQKSVKETPKVNEKYITKKKAKKLPFNTEKEHLKMSEYFEDKMKLIETTTS